MPEEALHQAVQVLAPMALITYTIVIGISTFLITRFLVYLWKQRQEWPLDRLLLITVSGLVLIAIYITIPIVILK